MLRDVDGAERPVDEDGNPIRVSLRDRWGFKRPVTVGKPAIFCNPVRKEHNDRIFEISIPEQHPVCYKLEGDLDRLVNNQFGLGQLFEIDVWEFEMLCVPSLKNDWGER